MFLEQNHIENNDADADLRKHQPVPVNHTEIGHADLAITGQYARVQVHSSNVKDFIEVYEWATKNQSGRDEIHKTAAKEGQSSAETPIKPARTQAFISYSHTDKKYLNELHTHLAYYGHNEVINFWDDTNIVPGAKRFEEISKALQAARVAVLLVSPEFLAADFVAANELPPLLLAAEQEGAVILSVILRPCAFTHTELAKFQAMHAPSRPLSHMSRGKRDEVWANVAERVKAALEIPTN